MSTVLSERVTRREPRRALNGFPPYAAARPQFSFDFSRLLGHLARFSTFGLPTFALVVGLHQLKGGWDDGAITAAFARTFVDSGGRIALTPFSEQVEGFSSVSWMLLLAISRFFSRNPDVIVIWMKFLAALSFLLSLLVVRRIASRLMCSTDEVNLACILASLSFGPILETLNGMEMNLSTLLVLCLVDILTNRHIKYRSLVLWAATAILVATRFESPYWVVAMLFALLFSQEQRDAFQLGLSALTAFLALEVWRLLKFGAWMPNTLYAKLQPPYSSVHQLIPALRSRILVLAEGVRLFGGPILACLFVIAAAFYVKRLDVPRWFRASPAIAAFLFSTTFLALAWIGFPYITSQLTLVGNEAFELSVFSLTVAAVALYVCVHNRTSTRERLIILLFAAGLLFGVLFGRNWGYPGRMILPCLPFFVLAVTRFIECQTPSKYWRRIILANCILVQACVSLPFVCAAWRTGDSVPISNIQKTGGAADAIRQLAGLDSLSIFVPDVGGTSLYYSRLEILDSGLLTNSYLAREGYGATERFLDEHKPLVIESHGIWSWLTRVYQWAAVKDYRPVVVGQTRLLLRTDLYSQVYSRLEATSSVHTAVGPDCVGGKNSGFPEEANFAMVHQSCLHISSRDLMQHGIDLR